MRAGVSASVSKFSCGLKNIRNRGRRAFRGSGVRSVESVESAENGQPSPGNLQCTVQGPWTRGSRPNATRFETLHWLAGYIRRAAEEYQVRERRSRVLARSLARSLVQPSQPASQASQPASQPASSDGAARRGVRRAACGVATGGRGRGKGQTTREPCSIRRAA